jgi:hypothetical protein
VPDGVAGSPAVGCAPCRPRMGMRRDTRTASGRLPEGRGSVSASVNHAAARRGTRAVCGNTVEWRHASAGCGGVVQGTAWRMRGEEAPHNAP